MILQSCQANWVLGVNDGCWSIADESGNILITLPKGLTTPEVTAIRRFAMDHEQLAFDEGVIMGNETMLAANTTRMRQMKEKIDVLEHMNKELSAKMQRFFLEEDED